MKSIDELTKYFGKYLLNPEFEKFREETLIKPTKYQSEVGYIVCKTSKIELGFTHKYDIDPELTGAKNLVFTHFIFYPATEKYFNLLPFGVTLKDSLAEIENKCGKPNEKKRLNDFLWGNVTILTYHTGNVKIGFTFDMDKKKISRIDVGQLKKEITE